MLTLHETNEYEIHILLSYTYNTIGMQQRTFA